MKQHIKEENSIKKFKHPNECGSWKVVLSRVDRLFFFFKREYYEYVWVWDYPEKKNRI